LKTSRERREEAREVRREGSGDTTHEEELEEGKEVQAIM